jgi:hypothetical protein
MSDDRVADELDVTTIYGAPVAPVDRARFLVEADRLLQRATADDIASWRSRLLGLRLGGEVSDEVGDELLGLELFLHRLEKDARASIAPRTNVYPMLRQPRLYVIEGDRS